MQVHQLLAGAARGDAITQIAANTKDLLRRRGVSDVFAHHLDDSAHGLARPLSELPESRSSDDALLLRLSIGDEALEEVVASRSDRLIVGYHNISPPELFEELDPGFAALLQRGRTFASDIAPRAIGAYADSTFNADDLMSLGFRDVDVVPPLLDPFRLSRLEPDVGFLVEIERRAPAELVLFVGQLLPHKRPELLISAHHLLTSHHRPDAALVIVGSPRFPSYFRQLANYSSALNLPRVWFTGPLSDRQLAELYRRADVFVTASAHEGFCVPITEAMAASVPVVASVAGAIPETLGGAGLLVDDPSPAAFAEAIDTALDRSVGAKYAIAGRQRAGELGIDAAAKRLDAFLDATL